MLKNKPCIRLLGGNTKNSPLTVNNGLRALVHTPKPILEMPVCAGMPEIRFCNN